MDYKELLMKYIQHVSGCEGISFIDRLNEGWGGSEIKFTEVEKAELEEIEKQGNLKYPS